MYNMQKIMHCIFCAVLPCVFRVVYKAKQRTELQFVPFRALLFFIQGNTA